MSQETSFDPLSMSANKRFTVSETYRITVNAVRSVKSLKRFKESRGEHFPERIMLAVTEVNGCALCAYAHTKFALEAGMEADEVRGMLGGVTEGAPDEELPAIAFAQHYADSGALPQQSAWEKLVEIYGDQDALGILSAIRVMMWGNAFGLPLSSIRARRAGTPQPNTSLLSDLGTTFATILVSPFALLNALVATILRKPLTPPTVATSEGGLGSPVNLL